MRLVGGSIPLLGSLVALAGAWSPVHDDGRTVHEGGGLGSQENARVGDLVHLAPAPHARAVRHRVVGLLGGGRVLLGQHAQVPLGLDGAGGNAVDADALTPPGHAERAGEVDDGGFGRAVVRHHGGAVDAGDGGDVDDHAAAALGHHLLARPLAAEEDAVHVDLDHGVPAVDADVLGLRAEGGARVI